MKSKKSFVFVKDVNVGNGVASGELKQIAEEAAGIEDGILVDRPLSEEEFRAFLFQVLQLWNQCEFSDPKQSESSPPQSASGDAAAEPQGFLAFQQGLRKIFAAHGLEVPTKELSFSEFMQSLSKLGLSEGLSGNKQSLPETSSGLEKSSRLEESPELLNYWGLPGAAGPVLTGSWTADGASDVMTLSPLNLGPSATALASIENGNQPEGTTWWPGSRTLTFGLSDYLFAVPKHEGPVSETAKVSAPIKKK